jgi:hypothetical protein
VVRLYWLHYKTVVQNAGVTHARAVVTGEQSPVVCLFRQLIACFHGIQPGGALDIGSLLAVAIFVVMRPPRNEAKCGQSS